ncbi:hypothetical protein ACHAWF_000560, partial [Thalassiosira exigua]
LLSQKRFTDDYATIALEAPELQETFIHETFIHVGKNPSQKNIRSSLARVMQMDKVLYHANARSDDGKSMYIVSKHVASQNHDQKTRNKTAPGEKPLASEYLVMVQVMVQRTTVESHGHTLGIISHMMRSYCAACCAGCGMCYHRASLLWMQHLHWGEGRPTPKPATSAFCSWIPGGRSERNCSTLEPATKLTIENLPASNAEAQAKLDRGRKYNLKEGLSASYDIYGGDKKKLDRLNSPAFASHARLENLFTCLRKSQASAADNSDNDA